MYIFLLIVTCPALTVPDNGSRTCSPINGEEPKPGDSCTFTCNPGFNLSGRAIRMCLDTGMWNDNSQPTCEPGVSCAQNVTVFQRCFKAVSIFN